MMITKGLFSQAALLRTLLLKAFSFKVVLIQSTLFALLFTNIQAKEVMLDEIAAIVNDDVVMLSEVKNAALKVKLSGNTTLSDESLIKKSLEQLILDKVQIQRAKALGITVDNSALNETMLKIAAQNKLSLEEFRKALIREGLNYKDFRESIRNKLYIDILKKRHKGSSKKITESDIDDLIKAESYRLNKDVQYHLLDIFIPAANGINVAQFNKTYKRAFSLRKQLLKTPGVISSTLLSKAGATQKDLGWKSTQALSPAYVRTLSLMGEGELSEIIHDARGFHIIKLLEQKGGLRKITEKARVRHILIPSTTQRGRLKAIQLRQKILAGESFAKLAKENSADEGSAQNGGELDMADPSIYVPPFANAVRTLPLNTMSQPIKTRFGWHIIEVLERKKSDETREALKKQAENLLTEKTQSEDYLNWLQGLRDEAYVDIRL